MIMVDKFLRCGKIAEICKNHAETKQIGSLQREGEWCKPLGGCLQATSCVARDDRDGSSRYRVAKMSDLSDKLGWYREYIFLAPKFGGEVYFL